MIHSEDFLRKLANKKVTGDFYPFDTDDIDKYDKAKWNSIIEEIKITLSLFNYNLLSKEELEKALDFNANIASNLINGQPRVFDCFFHWED